MAIQLVYEIEGNVKGEVASTSVYLFDGNVLADLRAFGSAFATLLNNFIGGKILSASLVFDIGTGFASGNTVEVYSDVEEKGVFGYERDESQVVISIPAIIETAVVDGTHNLDQTHTQVAALMSFIEDGIDVVTEIVFVTDVVGEHGGELDFVYAREDWVNSGKRRKR